MRDGFGGIGEWSLNGHSPRNSWNEFVKMALLVMKADRGPVSPIGTVEWFLFREVFLLLAFGGFMLLIPCC
jgi:hypothetical protein